MAEILSQEEINALLAAIAVEEEWNEADETPAARRPAGPGDAKPKVKPYDFARPDKLSKDQLRTLQMMHESFARGIASTLSAYLRSYVETEVVSADSMTYEEFARMLPNPGITAIFSLPPLEGSAMIEIDPDLGFAIIDRLLGGPGVVPEQVRELTELEQPVMRRVVEQIIDHLPDSWSQVVQLVPRFEQLELNPQFTHLVPPRDIVVVIRLEVNMASASGRLSLCIPYDVIESIVPKLSAHYFFIRGKKEATAAEAETLHRRLERLCVPVTAILGEVEVSFGDLLALEVGDYLSLETRINEPLAIKIGDRVKFRARPGTRGKRMAVQIVECIYGTEEEEEQP